jgi:hypothetical protein
MFLVRDVGSSKRRIKIALSFLIPVVLFSIWPIWIMVTAPQAVFLNLVKIPILNSQFLHQTGMFYKKYVMMIDFITTAGSLLTILIAAYLVIVLIFNFRRLHITNKKELTLVILLVLAFLAIAFVVPTTWKQYLAMPVPFIVIGLAYPLLYLRKLADDTHFKMASLVITACVVVTVLSYPIVITRIPRLFNIRNWVPVEVHNISRQISQKTKEPKLVLTLSPLLALEGGCNIYPQLSAGPFVYRIADKLSPADRDITHTVGLQTLPQLIEKSPPCAVVTGLEPNFLEEPILKTAVGRDWEKQTYNNGIVGYFKH